MLSATEVYQAPETSPKETEISRILSPKEIESHNEVALCFGDSVTF